MIRFFSKFRHNLIEQNRLGKYLKYALGEIVLVVVGILIALQVNSWQEDRKRDTADRKLFEIILQDLDIDNKKLKESYSLFEKRKLTYFHIYNETQGKAKFDSSVGYHNLRTYRISELIISANYSDVSFESKYVNINKKLEGYLRMEKWVESAYQDMYYLKQNTLFPYLARHGINNTKVLFENSSLDYSEVEDRGRISYPQLKKQFGTVEFDQMLFVLESKTLWLLKAIELLIDENEQLKIELEKELKLSR